METTTKPKDMTFTASEIYCIKDAIEDHRKMIVRLYKDKPKEMAEAVFEIDSIVAKIDKQIDENNGFSRAFSHLEKVERERRAKL